MFPGPLSKLKLGRLPLHGHGAASSSVDAEDDDEEELCVQTYKKCLEEIKRTNPHLHVGAQHQMALERCAHEQRLHDQECRRNNKRMSVPDELLRGMLTKLHLAPSCDTPTIKEHAVESSNNYNHNHTSKHNHNTHNHSNKNEEEERARRDMSFAPQQSVRLRGSFLAQLSFTESVEGGDDGGDDSDDLSLAESLENIEKMALDASLENIENCERNREQQQQQQQQKSLDNSNAQQQQASQQQQQRPTSSSKRRMSSGRGVVRRASLVSLDLSNVDEELSDIEEDDDDDGDNNEGEELSSAKSSDCNDPVLSEQRLVADVEDDDDAAPGAEEDTTLKNNNVRRNESLPDLIKVFLADANAKKTSNNSATRNADPSDKTTTTANSSNSNNSNKNNNNGDDDNGDAEFEKKIGTSLANLGGNLSHGKPILHNNNRLRSRHRHHRGVGHKGARAAADPRAELVQSIKSLQSSVNSYRSSIKSQSQSISLGDSFLLNEEDDDNSEEENFAGDFWAWRSSIKGSSRAGETHNSLQSSYSTKSSSNSNHSNHSNPSSSTWHNESLLSVDSANFCGDFSAWKSISSSSRQS